MAKVIISPTISFSIEKKQDIKKIRDYIKPGDIVSYYKINQLQTHSVEYLFKIKEISTKNQWLIADMNIITYLSGRRDLITGNRCLSLKLYNFWKGDDIPHFNLTNKGMVLRKINLTEAIHLNGLLHYKKMADSTAE